MFANSHEVNLHVLGVIMRSRSNLNSKHWNQPEPLHWAQNELEPCRASLLIFHTPKLKEKPGRRKASNKKRTSSFTMVEHGICTEELLIISRSLFKRRRNPLLERQMKKDQVQFDPLESLGIYWKQAVWCLEEDNCLHAPPACWLINRINTFIKGNKVL